MDEFNESDKNSANEDVTKMEPDGLTENTKSTDDKTEKPADSVVEAAAEKNAEQSGKDQTGASDIPTEAPAPDKESTSGAEQETIKRLIQTEVARSAAKKKTHPILVSLLAALLGLGAGYGGGVMAVKSTAKTAAVQTSSTQAPTITVMPASNSTDSDTVSTSGTMSVKQVASVATPTVVEIVTTVKETSYGYGFFNNGGDQSYTSEVAGSGVIISSDGYIITNNHIVSDATSIKVTTYDGTEYDASLIGTDEKSDIAVIKVNAQGLSAATIGDSSAISVGDTAIVIGNPLGTLGGTVTDGIISATDREITINNESMTLIQTNAAINSGNSGGGLFNDKGQLIGIVNAKDSGTTSSGATIEGLGFAIPINTAIDVANQLMQNGYVTDRATIGVQLETVSEDSTYGNKSVTAGLYISEVIAGSGAEAAGLKSGDRIIAIDGNDAETYQDLSRYLKTKEIGDTVKITVVRDNTNMDFNVTLTAPIK